MAYLVQETKSGKESIHSGQFMVSQFEAEEQDDEDNVAVPIPEVLDTKVDDVPVNETYVQGGGNSIIIINNKICHGQQICIDESLSKLFKCMSLAYRQKLTSPKWNRFRGIRLRWKDKIRLNNVIWRCWHLQFIRKENTLVCQFASPLDVDTHNKPEAIVLEGKYWKRKLAAVTAEYKKWRMFYRHHIFGHTPKEDIDMLNDVDQILMGDDQMMIDEDYMGLMSDTLFSTITNQPFVFPDTRELAKSGFADFIQPSLGPLQPNLDDYMDTFDPLQELCLNNKLPTVPEEQSQSSTWEFRDYQNNVSPTINSSQDVEVPNSNQYSPQIQDLPRSSSTSTIMNKSIMEQNSNQSVMISTQYNNNNNNSAPQSESSYIQNFPIISKLNNSKSNHIISRGKLQLQQSSLSSMPMLTYPKQPIVENNSAGVYQVYDTDSINNSNERLQVSMGGKSCAPQEIQQNDQFRTVSDGNSGYKFVTPVRPMITFTSLNLQQEQITSSLSSSSSQVQLHQSQMMHSSAPYLHVSQSSCYSNNFPSLVQNEMKMENKARGTFRGRGRSRSNTREPIKKPPLISAASDPALISPQTNVLLTQLLTNSSPLSEAVQVAYTQNLTNSPDLGLSSSSTINHRRIIKEEITPLSIIPPSSSSSSSILSNNVDSSSSPPNIHSPTSSQGSLGSPGHENCSRDGRRAIHIHAEQKRRVNIRNGFDMIHTLIPQLNENPNAKLSKANMLKTGANYIKQLRTERNQLRDEMDSLRQQIESLNTSISNCQSMLPATGAPVSRRRDSRMQEMFDEYVSKRTMENWKFCIFSLICRPLLNSFNNFVSTTSLDDLYTSTCHWVEQHCTLVDLRPVVLNSLRYLCTKTEILSEPEKLPEEAKLLVLNNDKK